MDALLVVLAGAAFALAGLANHIRVRRREMKGWLTPAASVRSAAGRLSARPGTDFGTVRLLNFVLIVGGVVLGVAGVVLL